MTYFALFSCPTRTFHNSDDIGISAVIVCDKVGLNAGESATFA